MSEEKICVKCGGSMEKDGKRKISIRQEGGHSRYWMKKVRSDWEIAYMLPYRCRECGYIEFWATNLEK